MVLAGAQPEEVGGAGGRVDCRILRHLAPPNSKASAAKKRYAAPRMATMRGATSWKRPSILLSYVISISCGNEEPTSYPPSVKIYGISAPGFVAVSEFFGNIGENQSFEICSFNFVV